MNYDTPKLDLIRNTLQKITGKEIEQVDGTHMLQFGQGVFFRVHPIGDSHVLIIFRQPYFEQDDQTCLKLLEELTQRLRHLLFNEPHVVEIDSKVNPERNQKSYRLRIE